MICPHPEGWISRRSDGWFCYHCDTHYETDPRKRSLEDRITALEKTVVMLVSRLGASL